MPRCFACLIACLASLLLAPLSGCETLNPGGKLPDWGPVVIIETVPDSWNYFSGDTAFFAASWTGGTAPYQIQWDFGGGTEPDSVGLIAATSPNVQSAVLSDLQGGTFTATVEVTDAGGLVGRSQRSYTYYHVENRAPILSVADGEGTTVITIHATDYDGDDVYVSVSTPAGFLVDVETKIVPGGEGEVTFYFSPEDILAGGTGIAGFWGGDGTGATDWTSATVSAIPISLAPDTLYAIPLESEAVAGEPARIVVATGIPGSPFRFLNGCRVIAPTGFEYVSASFNVGYRGGDTSDTDGFWTAMNPGGGFLLAPDNFIQEYDLGNGLAGISFNVTPIGGSDQTTASGALFNFEATFTPGQNVLGFALADGPIKRTYYSDGSATEYFWGDITNNHAGVPNSVMVE